MILKKTCSLAPWHEMGTEGFPWPSLKNKIAYQVKGTRFTLQAPQVERHNSRTNTEYTLYHTTEGLAGPPHLGRGAQRHCIKADQKKRKKGGPASPKQETK
eukprot:24351-Pelagomonas_calceolata.AAC.2